MSTSTQNLCNGAVLCLAKIKPSICSLVSLMTIQVCTVLLTVRLNCLLICRRDVGNRVTWNQVLNLADQVMSIHSFHCNV